MNLLTHSNGMTHPLTQMVLTAFCYCSPGYDSYCLKLFAFTKAAVAATRHATPPMMTDNGAPINAARVPASNWPNRGPPMKKIMLIEVMRPRNLFGVTSCRIG